MGKGACVGGNEVSTALPNANININIDTPLVGGYSFCAVKGLVETLTSSPVTPTTVKNAVCGLVGASSAVCHALTNAIIDTVNLWNHVGDAERRVADLTNRAADLASQVTSLQSQVQTQTANAANLANRVAAVKNVARNVATEVPVKITETVGLLDGMPGHLQNALTRLTDVIFGNMFPTNPDVILNALNGALNAATGKGLSHLSHQDD